MAEQKPKRVSSAPEPISPVRGSSAAPWERPRAKHVHHKVPIPPDIRFFAFRGLAGFIASSIYSDTSKEYEEIRAGCAQQYESALVKAIVHEELQVLDSVSYLPLRSRPGLAEIEDSSIAVAELARWGESVGLVFEQEPDPEESREPERPAPWPWGEHETELLRQLKAAAKEWWSTYDPAQPDTAPTNEEVTEWLQNRGVSNRVAEVMAQILRADGLPTGRRK